MKLFILYCLVAFLFLGLFPSCNGDDDDDSDNGASDDDVANDDDATDDDDTVDDDDTADDDDTTDDDDIVVINDFTLVEIVPETSPTLKLAAQACAGLYNRETGGSIYTVMKDKDTQWMEELDLEPIATTDPESFVATCAAEFPCVRYSYTDQQILIPNILTVGAVLGAIPIDETMSVSCTSPVFDAVTEFAERETAYLATKYVYENYVDQTTGLAMLNPGYDSGDSRVWDPALNRDAEPSLVDYIYSRKLFTIYLVNGCIESTQENALFTNIAKANPWASPIGVYGYADYWLVFGGYLFEAQTRCLESRNMGAIPSKTSNLSFFSTRRAPITEAGAVEQNPLEEITYDANLTYVAFVVGDGDNISYIMDSRSQWIRQRLADCEQQESSCVPITWTISPHLPYIAPEVLEWYYEMSHRTGKDYFMLPPSGHLYAYPGSLAPSVQNEFVAATEQDALLLGTTSTIDWEWWNTWQYTESAFFPKYAGANGVIKGVFPVNVPYMFPTFTWPDPNQTFKLIDGPNGGSVVLFRPREWRGIDGSGSGITEEYYLTPEDMADELAGYPQGTVAYVYMTSDGGLSLENSVMALVELLPDHVRLVSADTAVRLALESQGR